MYPSGGHVVDVGFGQGYFLEEAAALGLRSTGVDRDEQLVRAARARGLTAFQADAQEIGSAVADAVDGVMVAHLIEHLAPDAVEDLLHQLAAVVRPSGIAVFATPNPRDWRVISEWFWNDPTHVRPYTRGAVSQLLDPDEWTWDADGLVPVSVTRETPRVLLGRVWHGRDYGRPSRWYRLLRR
jgi:SAM-dependent methyltransferase